MSYVKSVAAEDFGVEVLHAAEPVVVDLYADWCGPCRALAPLLERFARQYAGRVKFLKVNVDEEPQVAGHFSVNTVPTLLVFDHGRLVYHSAGLPDPRGFVVLLDRLAGQPVTAAS